MKNFIAGIKNIIKWLPIIYKDKDWDSHYIYKLLYFKFKNMEEEFDGSWFVGEDKVQHKIMICKNLCKRLMINDYIPMTDDYQYLYKGNIISPEMEIYKHENYMIQQDIDYLFMMLKKHIREFWK